MHVKVKYIYFILLSSLCAFSASCSWAKEDVYVNHMFLSYRYKLESCGDVHGQDISEKIWFNDYKPDYYTQYFDLNFERTYADFRAGVDERGVGYGYGTLSVLFSDGTPFIHKDFSYYCTLTSTTGGCVVSNLDSDMFGDQVHSIYWVRMNVAFKNPETQEPITLTLHFRNGEPNPRPPEYKQ